MQRLDFRKKKNIERRIMIEQNKATEYKSSTFFPPLERIGGRKNSCSAYILAGGKSQRMGTDKGLLLLAGKPFVSHICEAVKSIVDENIVIVSSQMNIFISIIILIITPFKITYIIIMFIFIFMIYTF